MNALSVIWPSQSPWSARRLVMLSAFVAGLAFLLLLSVAGLLVTLAAVAFLVTFALAWRSTSFGVGAVLLTVPVQGVAEVTAGPVSLTWTKIIVAAAVMAWGLRVLLGDVPLRFDLVAGTYTIYVAVLMASVVNARDLDAWAEEVYRWGIALVVYVMAASAARERWFGRTVLATTAVAVIGVSIAGMIQVTTGAGPASFTVNGLTRAYAAFGEPNPFAAYLEMTVPLLVAVALAGLRIDLGRGRVTAPERLVWVWTAAVAFGCIALMLTQSRGGWLGFLAGMAAVLLLTGGRARWLLMAGAAALVIVLLAASVIGPIGERVSVDAIATRGNVQVTPDNFSVQERLAHWRAGIAMAEAHPLLGVGAGNFSDRFREFTPVWRFRISRGHAHNSYIQAAAQSGLAGLAAYLALLGAVALRLGGRMRTVDKRTRSLVIGAIGVTVAVMVHGMFDYLHVLSLGLQLSAVWALADAGVSSDDLAGDGVWRDEVDLG
jgi:O-antigen ligase